MLRVIFPLAKEVGGMCALLRPAVLAGLFGLAGCAAHHAVPEARAPAVAPAANLGYATIVAARQGGIEGTRILAAIGLAPGSAEVWRGEIEFIVRTEDGTTLSVVQVDRENLRPGERVALTSGARTRLVRLVDSGSIPRT
jgi:outer membrane lipoprotein SlyB